VTFDVASPWENQNRRQVIVAAEGGEPTTVPRVEAQAADSAQLLNVSLKRLRPEDYQTVPGRLVDADNNLQMTSLRTQDFAQSFLE
jgi:hypothetical protein